MSIYYIDGSGWNGNASRFCVYRDGCGEVTIFEQERTSNEMEYEGLLYALRVARFDDTVFTDSQLLVGHVTKGWKVKAEHLREFVQQAKQLVAEKRITLKWIPRSQNLAGHLLER